MTYVDAGPDPQYPDRPDHPDFRIMSRVSQDLNGDSGRPGWGDGGNADLGSFFRRNTLDEDSVHYMVMLRVNAALDVLQHLVPELADLASSNERVQGALHSIYFDAFGLGYEVARERHPQFRPIDGQARAEAIREAGR